MYFAGIARKRMICYGKRLNGWNRKLPRSGVREQKGLTMPDPFEPRSDNDQPSPQLRFEDLDFAKLTRSVRYLLLGLVVLVILMGLNWARAFYTDWLWFSNIEHEAILLTRVTSQIWLYLLGLMVFVALAAPNLFVAYRSTAGYPRPGQQLSPEAYQLARKLLLWVGLMAVVIGAILMAGSPAGRWESFLRFFRGVAFHETDPIFQKDFSFYIFTLPILEFVRSWLLGVMVAILVSVAGFYYVADSLRGESFSLEGKVKSHLLVLGALIFLLIAAGHWLGRYDLLYSPTGAVYGIGYTDNHVTLPARGFLTIVALICAGLLVASIRFQGNRLIILGVGGWIVLGFLAGIALPGMVQRLYVEPSELAREKPYLTNNIDSTRKAYGLETLISQSHPALGEVEAEAVAKNQGTISNIRLWDEGPLLQSYNQIQFFRLYYDFLAVQTDRYIVDGELRQVMIATRELSAEKLPEEAQRWVNRYLQFTHGYGIAMSPVTEVAPGGRPNFFVRDVPPKGEIALNRPEIYYGLKSLNFAIVRSGMKEFNYPGQDGPVYTRYDGNGGVEMSSFFRRLMYAWQFRDINILISGEINRDSRLQYRRTIPERFSTVTPFLMQDREAYTVVADGRLYFIQDAYTVTDRYPYSTPWQDQFNYIRNSVKTVIDTYNGAIDYYVFDPTDPLIQTYQKIFPGLFKSADEMPDYLREHIRYPMDQFTVQSQMLLQYHMKDPVVFYNKEDQWSIPVQTSFGRADSLRPYYIVARLPGEEKEEFLLIQPFTPNKRHNLVGWMAARSDGDRYGELILFRFPSGRHVDGPSQVEARIDNDAVISEQFTLWGQVGSEVLRGNLLVIPIGDSLLYAEPVFLKPETLDFPELRRIILADERKVVMHPSLDASVDALVGKLPPVAPVVQKEEEIPAEKPGVRPAGMEAIRRGLQEAIDKLQEVANQLGRMTP